MTKAPSPSAIFQAKLAAGVIVWLVLLGLVWYGFSAEVRDRMGTQILARPGGPITFRFLLQPAMAATAALRDGLADARAARPAFLWSLARGRKVGRRLSEALVATARIILLGVAMDAIYQAIVLHTFYPGEAAIVALMLAFLPYVLLRGPFARIARMWAPPAAPGPTVGDGR